MCVSNNVIVSIAPRTIQRYVNVNV